MAYGGDRRGPVEAEDVEALRARLRQSSALERTGALGVLRSWRGRPLGAAGAPAVLRAATNGYPWVADVPDDPGEMFVQLLWDDPHQVPVEDVERAYMLCADRGRRALLHLLALRADAEAVQVVGGLIGLDGPWDLLPVPSSDLLMPLVDAPGVERLTASLVSVAWRRGWSQHAADLLGEMVLRGLLDDEAAEAVATGLEPLVAALVDTCDRATLNASGREDISRAERRRLASLLPLFAHLAGERAERVLLRALSSADPRIAAHAAVGLARRGVVVPRERLQLVGRDPESRAVLLDGLGALGRHFALPEEHLNEVAVAEAELIRWLVSETQMAAAPDEVEHRAVVRCPPEWGHGRLHVFVFRVRPPHWSAERGWMVGVVGPFDAGAEFVPRRADGFAAHSLYLAEDDDDLAGHVQALADALLECRRDEAA